MAALKSTRRTAVAALLWSQVSYWGAVAMAAWALTCMPAGSIRSALTMTPIAPAVLIVAVSYWIYRANDEYVRQQIVQAAAVTAIGMVLFVTVCYYLELAGLPPLSLAWIGAFGWTLFGIQLLPLFFMRSDEE